MAVKKSVFDGNNLLPEQVFQTPTQKWASNEFLIQFKPGISASFQNFLLKSAGVSAVESLNKIGNGPLLAKVGSNIALDAIIKVLEKNPSIEFLEKNWVVSSQAVSNEPYYSNNNLWGLYGDKTSPANQFGSQAGEAWQKTTGSLKTVVGVIDSGIDYTHPDLYQNIWINQKEISSNLRNSLVDFDGDGIISFRDLNSSQNANFVKDTNGNRIIDGKDLLQDTRWADGLDQDGNGYKDDLIGWDFINSDNDPFDDNDHGTHVAGTIAAVGGNGVGVAGVAWNTSLMPLKFLDANGDGTTAGATAALDYYTKASQAAGTGQNFVATNNSWGGGGASQSLTDAIVRSGSAGNLFIAAAGNAGKNNDESANYPSNYTTQSKLGFETVIAVAALNNLGNLASFSNFGANSVDLAAPGDYVLSTIAGGQYAYMSGTSMATPHVAGAVALFASANPDASAAQIQEFLMQSVQPTFTVSNITATGGRLDAEAFLAKGATANPTPTPTPTPEPTPTPTPEPTPEPAPTPEPTPTPAPNLVLYGTIYSDTITGGAGGDTLSGIPKSGKNLGKGTIDKLIGGAGNDLFILGDARGRFYDNGNSKNAGLTDYAKILDFATGDKIQLAKGAYLLKAATIDGDSGIGIYHDSNNNRVFNTSDELIGFVVGVQSMAATDFILI
ncbi:MAG: S8 family peptidase [Giesbergeria sp.]|uniref:S8 family peptidase n=1 Tax=Giesbergeria sp. TaxID=2818473 RepID=UPI00262BA2FB|nr:S8 family peptidase [Giesbergeria sp.]MDD2609412.1 S8 family peptidase [Giesbergeria sp.]